MKAGVTGSSTSSADDSTTWTSGDVTQFAKGINYSQTDSQALTNQLAQGFSRSGGESFSHTWGDSLSQNLSKSASEVVSASNSFNTMSQLQNQVGSMTNTDFKTLGAQSLSHQQQWASSMNISVMLHLPQSKMKLVR